MRRLVPILLSFALLPPPLAAAPALWRVANGPVHDYLIGSIHLLPADEAWPAGYERAYRACSGLVFETDMAAIESAAFAARMQAAGLLEPGRSLLRELGPRRAEALKARAAALGLPPALFEPLRPWMAAMTLELLSYLHAGFAPDHGVERRLHAQARRDGKASAALETPEQHLEIFAGLGPELGAELLDLVLEQAPLPSQPEALLRIWRDGDIAALDAMMQDYARRSPALHARLIADRNRRWMPRLRAHLRDDRADLIVVGLAHFPGEQGLLAHLAEAGFRLEPQP